MSYELMEVTQAEDWKAYHDIRRTVLFEGRGRFGVYDEHRPEERESQNHSLLLKLNGAPIGTVRLDELGEGHGAVRLVAIRPDLQRRGHGRVLSDLVEDYARTLKIGTLFVNAAPESVGFYEKLSWSRFEWEDPAELGTIAEDCVQMKKDLD